jgi:transporter family protein
MRMRPHLFALLTAAAWGIGGYFEKRGLLLGGLSPQIGSTLRTATAVVLGGGVLAGTVGMFCFYAAIKGGALSQVMPIAFTSPLFGVALAMAFGGEPVTAKAVVGMVLAVGGIALLSSA